MLWTYCTRYACSNNYLHIWYCIAIESITVICQTLLIFLRFYLIKVWKLSFHLWNVSWQSKSYLFIAIYSFGNPADHFIKLTFQFKVTTSMNKSLSKVSKWWPYLSWISNVGNPTKRWKKKDNNYWLTL